MKQLRIALLVALLLVLLAAGCGGDEEESVPGDAIAVVSGNEIAKTEFDGLISQAKKSYKAQKRTFPKVGTAEYNVLKNQAVQFLVQLEQQGLTDEQVRRDIRAQLVQEGIFKKVTEDVKVTDKQVEDYYNKNKAQYGTPETRDVRHILVPTKKQADSLYTRIKGGDDFAKLAKQFSKDPGSKDQ